MTPFGDEPMDPELVKKFMAFHARNPALYDAFHEHAKRVKATGRGRYGAWTIFQVLRWNRDIVTTGDEFKISNDFIALYARLLIAEHPEFAGFFALKRMKAKRKQVKRAA